MRCAHWFLFSAAFVLVLMVSASAQAQQWAGIIDPSRAVNWSSAGVVGGIPNRTTVCTTLNPGATAAQINSAISTCPSGQVVFLNAGTYSISDGGIVMQSNVTLRGAGANQTFLVFTANNGCIGAFAVVCFAGGDSSDYYGDAKMQPGGTNAATWTSGYVKGTTQIVLNNIGSNGISVGKWIVLDQANDTATNSGYFDCESTSATPPCSAEGGKGDPGRIVGGVPRQVTQVVKVIACSPCTSGSTFTISPGVYMPNIVSGKSPGAWWPSVTIQNAGIENLSIDSTNSSGSLTGIEFFNAFNSLVSGTRNVRSCTCDRAIMALNGGAHNTIRNNYVYGTSGHSQNYGIEILLASDTLVENNIFQHTVVPVLQHGSTGSVLAYNYSINNSYDDGNLPLYHYMIGFTGGHSAMRLSLMEGNVGQANGGDVVHGTNMLDTVFRSWLLGSDPTRIDNTYALQFESYARYWNVIGNVLGTAGFTTSYAGSNPAIYQLGVGRGIVGNDTGLATTLMRWGNYDVVTQAVRWCGNSSDTGWSTTCASTSEVPTGIGAFANAVPATETLPASLYYWSKPSWWPSAKPWPPIGPDVSGGNISVGGHAYTIPAQDCYSNVMGGPAGGTGNVLSFNANACYGQLVAQPAPPTNLTVVVN